MYVKCVSLQFSTVVLLWLDFKRAICVKTSPGLMAWEEAIWHLTLRNSSNHNTQSQTLAAGLIRTQKRKGKMLRLDKYGQMDWALSLENV